MLSLSFILGLASIASSSPLVSRNATNSTFTPGHYLAESITSQTFYNNTCTAESVSIWREWRSLTHDEKIAFVDAKLCLMNLPAISGLPGAQSRFDDFQAGHQQGTNTSDGDIIHYTVSYTTLSIHYRVLIHFYSLNS